jgi:hypothetical protein
MILRRQEQFSDNACAGDDQQWHHLFFSAVLWVPELYIQRPGRQAERKEQSGDSREKSKWMQKGFQS